MSDDWAMMVARAGTHREGICDYGSTQAIQQTAALLRAAYQRGRDEVVAQQKCAPVPDRLALARALVADLPGVVVAEIPEEYPAPPEHNGTYFAGERAGWNALRSRIIAAGSPTDGR